VLSRRAAAGCRVKNKLMASSSLFLCAGDFNALEPRTGDYPDIYGDDDDVSGGSNVAAPPTLLLLSLLGGAWLLLLDPLR
jgi:hypothetical protein